MGSDRVLESELPRKGRKTVGRYATYEQAVAEKERFAAFLVSLGLASAYGVSGPRRRRIGPRSVMYEVYIRRYDAPAERPPRPVSDKPARTSTADTQRPTA